MKLVTDRQLTKIRQTIRDQHLLLVVSLCGAQGLPTAEYDRLTKLYTVKEPKSLDYVTAAHALGVLLGDATSAVTVKTEPAEFWKVALSTVSKFALDDTAVSIGRASLSEHIRSMGSRTEAAIMHALTAASNALRKKRMAGLGDAGARAQASNFALREVRVALQKARADSLRDWMRIVHTELHNIVEEGKAITMMQRGGGYHSTLVYKRPRPDACPYCKLLYLKPDGSPRIFRLKDLLDNGTNIGRKPGRPVRGRTGWKPVLGAVHPWCQCTLHYVPPGAGFNAKGQLVPMQKSMTVIDVVDRSLLNHECTHD